MSTRKKVTDAPETDAPTEALAPVLSLTEESEHETITRAERVYIDEMRATDEHGNVFAIQREKRADGSEGAREVACIKARKEGGESRQALRFLTEYGAAARAFRNAGAYLFPRFLDDLTSDECGALAAARETESA
jgi:hypothetical protein